MTITLYGIDTCATVRKARAWFAERGAAPRYHELRRDGLAPERLDAWIAALGTERLLNTRGTTWRRLPEAARTHLDAAATRALLLAQPTLIRRPVVEWPDGTVSVGFDAEAFAARCPAP
ncbi:Spx/MgsR family transcriptional regulator [Plasticicumulans lactativorans]|uniref:Spx/MgsR family transcriptional regulator n=1 Tax=Plasticicumulans lactativorans TaxID=1133106 RepID=A0A4R2L358_9GAMM|nr:Spx/MgsR family RNA polymerase-binding regulatory protein [Plasticicumulans lactativorans]TCO80924.1 Spx/MgsR family transcriptional regulator [Plasticicumulans lactativorans]